MFVISFNICLFIYFYVKNTIQSNDCDVFVNKQSIIIIIINQSHSFPNIGGILFPHNLPHNSHMNIKNLGWRASRDFLR